MKDLEGVGEVLLSSCTMLEKSEVSFDTMPSTAGVLLLTSDDEFWDFSMISYDEPSYSVDWRYEPIFSSQKLQFSHTPKTRSAASLFQATW
jgi:hypothetical protein